MKDLYVIGAGGHARVLADLISSLNTYKLCGFIVPELNGARSLLRLPLIAEKDFVLPRGAQLALGIGDNFSRGKVYQKYVGLSSETLFPALIHPRATVSAHATVAEGAVCMAGSVLQYGAYLGVGTFLNTQSSVDHDCHLSDFCSVGPGAILGGNVKLGAFTSIGLGALVKHGCSIGNDTVIGMGSLVLKDIPASVTAYGQPCEVIKKRSAEEAYL